MKKKSKKRDLALILAGGQSLRLFPLTKPKPLLEVNGRSLLEMTFERLDAFDCYIVTNKEVGATLSAYFKSRGKPAPKMLFEPEGRDTAAAVGFGLRHFKDDDRRVAVLSADHYIPELKDYRKFLQVAMDEVDEHPEALFVAGSLRSSKPTSSHSQFGWILPTKKKFRGSSAVERFVEKPRGSRLSSIRKQGGLINAGTFFGKLGVFKNAYQEFFPEALNPEFPYKKLERQPIDRAIFEKFSNVRVLSLRLKWEDLGTWATVDDKVGSMPYQSTSKHRNFFWSDVGTELYVDGLTDFCIIHTNGKILVIPKAKSGDLKKILKRMK